MSMTLPLSPQPETSAMDTEPWGDALINPVPSTVCYTRYLVCVQCIDQKNQWFQTSKASKNIMSVVDLVTPPKIWNKPLPIPDLNEIFQAVGWYPYPPSNIAVPEVCAGDRKEPLQWALVRTRR